MEVAFDTDRPTENPGEYEPVLPTTEEHTAAELTETMKPQKTDSYVHLWLHWSFF